MDTGIKMEWQNLVLTTSLPKLVIRTEIVSSGRNGNERYTWNGLSEMINEG